MTGKSEQAGVLKAVGDYVRHLDDPAPYWKVQAIAWGIVLMVVVLSGGLFAVCGLSGVFGGGNISYPAEGSPGPVTFRHYSHMWFQNGKYKECATCHEKLFAAQKYGTYVLRALKDSPTLKVHIGRDASGLYVPTSALLEEKDMVTYEVPRACATCATGNCHDGKESFSRLECLKCHQAR